MADGLVSFGAYTFPTLLRDYQCNFGNGVPQTSRIPGMHGSWLDSGYEELPTAQGVVQAGFIIEAATRAAMDAQRDAVWAMKAYGMAQLIKQPTLSSDEQRFCMAQINNISMVEQKHEHTDLFQPVQVTWHVPDPHWYADSGYIVGTFNGAYQFDSGLTFDANAYDIAASGTETTDTLATAGTAVTIPVINVNPGAGNSCEDPTIERIVSGVVVDRIKLTGTLSGDVNWQVNGKVQTVRNNGSDAFSTFSYIHPDFFRLAPGDNSIKITFANAGDQATVSFVWWDAFR